MKTECGRFRCTRRSGRAGLTRGQSGYFFFGGTGLIRWAAAFLRSVWWVESEFKIEAAFLRSVWWVESEFKIEVGKF